MQRKNKILIIILISSLFILSVVLTSLQIKNFKKPNSNNTKIEETIKGNINNQNSKTLKDKMGDTFTDKELNNLTEEELDFYNNYKEYTEIPDNKLSESTKENPQYPGDNALTLKKRIIKLTEKENYQLALDEIDKVGISYQFTAPNNSFISYIHDDLSMTKTVLNQEKDNINPNFLSQYRDSEILSIVGLFYPLEVLTKYFNNNCYIPIVLDSIEYLDSMSYYKLPESNTDNVLLNIFNLEDVEKVIVNRLLIDDTEVVKVYIMECGINSSFLLYGYYPEDTSKTIYKTVDYWVNLYGQFRK